jgi:dienelactone hydrolase
MSRRLCNNTMRIVLSLLSFMAIALAHPQVKAATPYDPNTAGGIFGINIELKSLPSLTGSNGKGSPMSFGKEGGMAISTDSDGGNGPFKAQYKVDETLPSHTVYAPKSASAEVLPVIVFGNGGCLSYGTMYLNLLQEIASHGFLVIANGKPSTGSALLAGQGKAKELTDSIDWVYKNVNDAAFIKRYGKVDPSRLAAMGQSCGGLEAYSASYGDDRVKHTILLNSGVLDRKKEHLLQGLKAPVAYFLGGPLDIAWQNVSNLSRKATDIGLNEYN